MGPLPAAHAVSTNFEGHGIGKVLVPLVVRRGAAKEMPANCHRLKDRLESMTSQPAKVRTGTKPTTPVVVRLARRSRPGQHEA